jgi:hypothetical protein
VADIRKKFSLDAFSDHMIYLIAFNEFRKAQNKRQFCGENFLSISTMDLISGIRQQLFNQIKASGFVRDSHELNKNSEKWPVIKAALCAGAYPKLIRFDQNIGQIISQKDTKIRFHQSSQLYNNPNSVQKTRNIRKLAQTLPSDWLIYEEMLLIGRTSYAKCCTSISPITVALFCGPNCSTENTEIGSTSSDGVIQIDDWITFKADRRVAHLVMFLRRKLHQLFFTKIDSLSKAYTPNDESIINAVISVLETEEIESGFERIERICLKSNETFKTDYFGAKYHQVFNVYRIYYSEHSNYLHFIFSFSQRENNI